MDVICMGDALNLFFSGEYDELEMEDIPGLCNKFGLEYISKGEVELDIEPVIVLRKVNDRTAQAILISDIGPLIGNVEVIGVIRLKPSRQRCYYFAIE